MSKTQSDFLADIARKVAASDAQADADLADILAGRPLKKRSVKQAGESAAPEPPKKPRARRKSTKTGR